MRALLVLFPLAACATAAPPSSDPHRDHTAPAADAAAPAAARTGVPATVLPGGWRLLSTPPGAFAAEVDRTVAHGGRASGRLGSASAAPSEFGSLMQTIRADGYVGRRVRLSARVRTRGVGEEAGLWMRVDGRGTRLAFDNMETRPVTGDVDWARHEVVLDVPEGSAGILFGVWMHGTGSAWIDDVALEVVGPEVPVTGHPMAARAPVDEARVRQEAQRFAQVPARPANLDFEAES